MSKITPKPDGPLLVQGVPMLKQRGRDIAPEKPVYALCS